MDNGLTVLLQEDNTTSQVAVCILYKVGSRDEVENKTGLAHLFEHLMFSNCGPGIDFDEILLNAGGDCNAFTTTDTTQYYSVAPAHQLEWILALEAHRMSGFHLSKKDFKTQQRVVIEEFSEVYLNNPYGMFMHHLMDMAYTVHPYRWPVIGKTPEQLNQLQLEDAQSFHHNFYQPANAILVVSGKIEVGETKKLIEAYFSSIPSVSITKKIYPVEPELKEIKTRQLHLDIPEEGFFYAFPYCGRTDPDFYAVDLLTDILAEGKSSLLFQKLKKEMLICSGIDCYINTTRDPGLVFVEAKINPGHSIEEAEMEFWKIVDELKSNEIDDRQWEKYMNKNESAYLFSQLGLTNQALNLSYAEWLDNPDLIYTELEKYTSLEKGQIKAAANKYFQEDRYCALYYRKI